MRSWYLSLYPCIEDWWTWTIGVFLDVVLHLPAPCCRLWSYIAFSFLLADLVDRFIHCLLLLPSIYFWKGEHRFSTNCPWICRQVAASQFCWRYKQMQFYQLSVYFCVFPFSLLESQRYASQESLCYCRCQVCLSLFKLLGYFIFLFSPSKASPVKDRANMQSTKWVFHLVLDPALTWFQVKAWTYYCLVWFRNVCCLIAFRNITYFFWDSEVVEKPTPAKKKWVYLLLPRPCLCKVWRCYHSVAAKRSPTPPPKSQAFKDLPPVSISWAPSIRFCPLWLTCFFVEALC